MRYVCKVCGWTSEDGAKPDKCPICGAPADKLEAITEGEKTYATDPGIINFDIYEEILIKLIQHYYINNKDIEMDLYRHKLIYLNYAESKTDRLMLSAFLLS